MLNEVDEEIIQITKEIFRSKKNDAYYDPDDLLKQSILKILFYLSSICIILLFLSNFINLDIDSLKKLAVSPTVLFFGAYSLYLNSKVSNFSVLIAIIAIISMFTGILLS